MITWFGIGAFVFLAATPVARADSSALELEVGTTKQHITADRTLYHSNEKVYEAFGHVIISAKGQRLTADYAWIDMNTDELRARGNVILVTPTSIINAAEIHFNIATQIGSIFYGRVANDFYTLKGQLIRKISADRFLTTDGEYSTCRDCAESWKIAAKNVDLTFEGYAFMDNAFINVKDTPTLYVPFLVLPVKQKRQTGLLFPRVSTGGGNGIVLVQPLFIAIDPHQDATIGYGTYSSRGKRAEFEYRYKSYDKVNGTLNAYYLKDRTLDSPRLNRYAISTTNDWSLFNPVTVKWRLQEVSDHEYTRVIGDVGVASDPALESNALATATLDDLFVSAEAKRYRNMLYEQPFQFDGATVQSTPSVYFGTKERTLGPLAFNVYGRFDNYVRSNGSFDDENANGQFDSGVGTSETIREAQRFILTPTVAAPFRLGPSVTVAPSIEYNQISYRFPLPDANSRISQTSRQYLVTRLETSSVLQRIYDVDSEKVSKIKHQFIPKITYSYIPLKQEDSNHPFTQQIERPGGAFDQFDIVPITNSTNFTRLPLGNSLTYGFTSSLIRKNKKPEEIIMPFPYDIRKVEPIHYSDPVNKHTELEIERQKVWDKNGPSYGLYEKFWDFSVDQAYDFKEAASADDKLRAFSRLLAVSSLSLGQFSNSTEYTYYPRQVDSLETRRNVHNINTSFSWNWKSLSNANQTIFFKRALSLSYSRINRPPSRNISGTITWSLNDFFATEYTQNFDLQSVHSSSSTTKFIYSSPSECWQIGLHLSRSIARQAEYGIDFGVNMFGVGYAGVNQMSQSAGIGPIAPGGAL